MSNSTANYYFKNLTWKRGDRENNTSAYYAPIEKHSVIKQEYRTEYTPSFQFENIVKNEPTIMEDTQSLAGGGKMKRTNENKSSRRKKAKAYNPRTSNDNQLTLKPPKSKDIRSSRWKRNTEFIKFTFVSGWKKKKKCSANIQMIFNHDEDMDECNVPLDFFPKNSDAMLSRVKLEPLSIRDEEPPMKLETMSSIKLEPLDEEFQHLYLNETTSMQLVADTKAFNLNQNVDENSSSTAAIEFDWTDINTQYPPSNISMFGFEPFKFQWKGYIWSPQEPVFKSPHACLEHLVNKIRKTDTQINIWNALRACSNRSLRIHFDHIIKRSTKKPKKPSWRLILQAIEDMRNNEHDIATHAMHQLSNLRMKDFKSTNNFLTLFIFYRHLSKDKALNFSMGATYLNTLTDDLRNRITDLSNLPTPALDETDRYMILTKYARYERAVHTSIDRKISKGKISQDDRMVLLNNLLPQRMARAVDFFAKLC